MASDARFEWIGGRLALDFVNTVTWRPPPEALENERLRQYDDLVAWAREAGLLSADRARSLAGAAAAAPAAARRALVQARDARALLHAVFAPVARGERPETGLLDALDARVRGAWRAARVVERGREFHRQWAATPDDLRQIMRPVLVDAGDLLTSDRLSILRTCANERCGWLFLDTSRNGFRRWCDMRACGSRAKARRHYQRVRASRGAHEEPARTG